MPGTIVYHVVSPVHLRNAQLIAPEMSEWTFRVAYEPHTGWLKARTLDEVPLEKVPLANDKPPDAVWTGDVRCVIFSTAQPRQAPINLLRSALEHGVPTLAIEESNQIALNRGTVNNYVLPVDHVLAVSRRERRGMIEAGLPERRVEVTGWPFYVGQVGKTAPERVCAAKERLGLAADRPVAALTLTGLNDAGESPAVRRRQLTLAAQGLPPEYQLVVKPHPIERLKVLMPFVAECAPRAKAIAGSVRIDDLLEATDVLLNRGVSQVCIEALFREIPVIVLDTGVQTLFHGLTQDLIVEQPSDMVRALAQLSAQPDPMRIYAPFREEHAPYEPQRARELVCQRIAQIAESGDCDPDRARQWFDLALYQAWQKEHRMALESLSPHRVRDFDGPVDALHRLIQAQATRDDLDALKRFVGTGFRSHVLRCLWIDQLGQRHEPPTDADLVWMRDFPPSINTVWFVQDADRWANVLLRSGHSHAATSLARRLSQVFTHVPGTASVVRDVELHGAGLSGRAMYSLRRMVKKVHLSLRVAKRRLRTAF